MLSRFHFSCEKLIFSTDDDSQNPLSDNFDSTDTLNPGDDTSKKQIPHLVGYSFETPDPRTTETPTTAFTFNAITGMSQDVFEDEVGHDERPVLHPTPAVQSTDLPASMTRGKDGGEWTAVSNAWTNADFDAGGLFTQAWSQAMGWPTSTPLVAQKPTQLLAGFDTFYLSCPWIMATS